MNFKSIQSNNDRIFEAWFRDHYIYLILGFLFLFSGLPVLAPFLMKAGITRPAKVIYWVYGFFCHQFPFRSWFLYGFQPFYPLASAGIENILSFESVFHPINMNIEAIREIVGNSDVGYKVAICQRDIAMYISLLVFGLVFASQNRKIKKIPLWIWIVFGVIPLGLDGITQYIGNLPNPFFSSLMRESTPLLRTITGGIFGILTGWYVFPTLELIVHRDSNQKPE